ncbi:L-cysteine desulfidase family protein [Thermophilibacter sp.]
MDDRLYRTLCSILREELVCALGCTEPIAVAYAAALARRTLGAEPERMTVACSGNIVKNVKSVTVPNSDGMRGVEAAATLGAVGGSADSALEVLESVTPAHVACTRALLAAPGYCTVNLAEGVPNLYIDVTAEAAGHTARVVIAEHHTNVTLVELDGRALRRADAGHPSIPDAEKADRSGITVEAILDFAEAVELDDVRDVLERQLTLNDAISREGLEGAWGAEVGRTLMEARPHDVATRARARAAAGSDARMNGCSMPVVINCGSGNQGITCSMPVLEYAETWGVDRDRLLRALAVSDLTAAHLKSYIGSLSAFCGVVCAAAGAGAAICWMGGGTRDQVGETIVNTLGNVGGIVCDGAKSSCAAKISAAVDAATLGYEMAVAGRGFRGGEGLVQDRLEDTIRGMGYVGRVGMRDTDVEILNIMIGKTDVSRC